MPRSARTTRTAAPTPSPAPDSSSFAPRPFVAESASPTGAGATLPDSLRENLEHRSGFDLSQVRVHHNSREPERLGAAAFTRGLAIHLGPGQERHLPHESWHVVQQLQGRVRPTAKLHRVPWNNSPGLEQEATVQGARAAREARSALAPSAAPNSRPVMRGGSPTNVGARSASHSTPAVTQCTLRDDVVIIGTSADTDFDEDALDYLASINAVWSNWREIVARMTSHSLSHRLAVIVRANWAQHCNREFLACKTTIKAYSQHMAYFIPKYRQRMNNILWLVWNLGSASSGSGAAGGQHDTTEAAIHSPQDYIATSAGGSWKEVKTRFLRAGEPVDLRAKWAMSSLLAYRNLVTEALLAAQRGHWESLSTDQRRRRGSVAPVRRDPSSIAGGGAGSMSWTSDIDVNLSGDMTEWATEFLNSNFRKRFGAGRLESGIMYDVNFYARDFLPDDMSKSNWRDKYVAANANDSLNFALTRARIDMSPEDWETYRRAVAEANLGEHIRAMTLAQAKFEERQESLKPAPTHGVSSSTSSTHGHGSTANDEMAAENRSYEFKLAEVTHLGFQLEGARAQHAKTPTNATSKAVTVAEEALRRAQMEALMYANEAYLTPGSVLGVVANMQMLNNPFKSPGRSELQLLNHEYFDMLNEQFGRIFHVLDHAEGGFTSKVLDAGKYFHRMFNAAQHLFPTSWPLQEIGVNKDLGIELEALKRGLARKGEGGQEWRDMTDDELASRDEHVRSLLGLTSKVSNKKKAEKKAKENDAASAEEVAELKKQVIIWKVAFDKAFWVQVRNSSSWHLEGAPIRDRSAGTSTSTSTSTSSSTKH